MFRRLGQLCNWITGAPADGENLLEPTVVINGGTGGSGGDAMLQGGLGGAGEGPHVHLSAHGTVATGNLSYQYHHHYSLIATGPIPRRTMDNWVIPLAHRFIEFTAGDREKVLFVMYCAWVALWLPGPRHLANRLGLVPVFAIPFLVVPRILFPCAIITLVDVMGERRPMSLELWRNPTAFVQALQEIFAGNEELTTMIMSHSYRIQDRNCSVYGLGSHLVVAGGELFMAAVLYCEFVRLMNCPYCEADVPAVLPGYNFQTWIDCDRCHQRFSVSHAAAPSYSSLPAGTPESPSSSLPAESPRTTIPPRQTISRRQPASMKFVHLSLFPPVGEVAGTDAFIGRDRGLFEALSRFSRTILVGAQIPSDSDLYFNAMYITCHGTGSFEDCSAGGGEAPQFHVHGHSQWIINATSHGTGSFEDGSAGGGEAPQFHVHGHSQWIINATTYGAGTGIFEDGWTGGGEAPQFHVHGHSQGIINATSYGTGIFEDGWTDGGEAPRFHVHGHSQWIINATSYGTRSFEDGWAGGGKRPQFNVHGHSQWILNEAPPVPAALRAVREAAGKDYDSTSMDTVGGLLTKVVTKLEAPEGGFEAVQEAAE